MSDNTLSKQLRKQGIPAVVHGFRSSFRDWCAECSNAPREVCELALAHVNSDLVEAAYMRTDLFERRRGLIQSWADYLSQRGPAGRVLAVDRNDRGHCSRSCSSPPALRGLWLSQPKHWPPLFRGKCSGETRFLRELSTVCRPRNTRAGKMAKRTAAGAAGEA